LFRDYLYPIGTSGNESLHHHAMLKMFTSFVKVGDPNDQDDSEPLGFSWYPYTEGKKSRLIIDHLPFENPDDVGLSFNWN
jgi:hypothetical protein